jgi:hypothetical protein
MFEFSVSKDVIKEKVIIREVAAVGKVASHLCLTIIVKELKIGVEHGGVVITLNILFNVASLDRSLCTMYDDLAYDEDLPLHCLESTQT